MIAFTNPWQRELHVRNWRTAATTFLTVALIVAAATVGVLFGVTVWQWMTTNPAIAMLVAFYVVGPLLLLWLVVRIVRHAWRGQ